MFDASADLYDLFYGDKDYRGEAAYLAARIRVRVPDARTVLDVACGTGVHGGFLSEEHGFAVDGIDLDPGLLERAAARLPAGRFVRADMTAFDLGRTYDAVVCLFSSIGYVRHEAGLRRAIAAMARHVAPHGVLLVEPWFEPGVLEHGYVMCRVVDTPDGKACRMSLTEVEGAVSRLRFEYLVASPGGMRRASEVHELGVFPRDVMLRAFEAAGLAVEYDREGPADRGLYTAWRDASSNAVPPEHAR
jgi:SAM-dependent methyltransferase